MKILVTGGTGFIGSHTCVELIEAGYEPVIVDNLSNSQRSVVGRIKEITGRDVIFYHEDISDFAAMTRIFSVHEISAVIHFAGLKAVGESVEMPLEYYSNNISGTITLLKVMRSFGCRRMVFSSSATVYGLNNPSPCTEDMPLSATNPYGWTKVMIEQILMDTCKSDENFSITALRYFNPVGAHPSGLIGENPNGIPNNLVPYIALVASGKLEKLSIFGDDYATHDGTGIRDYIHVCDLARGHISALEYVNSHTGFEAINLGTGSGSSVFEMIHAYEKAAGTEIPYIVTERRQGDIAVSYADVSKAERMLCWRAMSGIDEMCRDSWNFVKSNSDGII